LLSEYYGNWGLFWIIYEFEDVRAEEELEAVLDNFCTNFFFQHAAWAEEDLTVKIPMSELNIT
jgi:hypothetical protein